MPSTSQFFQASPMKLLPLIGALLLSTAPVQAYETWEELQSACAAKKEISEICQGVADYVGSGMAVLTLCDFYRDGMIAAEDIIRNWEVISRGFGTESTLAIAGIKFALKRYPNCPIKPLH